MRKMLSFALLGLAVTAIAAYGADNSIGTWKVNIAKSRYNPAPMPLKSYTMVREAVSGGVKVTITGERRDGTPINAGYIAKLDGSPAAVTGTGTPYDSISVKQLNGNTFTAEGTNASNPYHANFRTVISNGGKTMTTTGTGKDANGMPMALTLVFDKTM